jgi:pseudoazurin
MRAPIKEKKMKRLLAVTVGLATLSMVPVAAQAAEHQVLMLNKDSEGRIMQFEPAFLKVEPGDTVTFVPQDAGHNSEAFPDKIPAGAEAWKGRIGQEVSVTFEEVGFYAYKCLPHVAMGMVGLIEVGDGGTADAALAEGIPGRGKARMEELIAESQEEAEGN